MFIEEVLLDGIIVIRKEPVFDNRGAFERVFCIDQIKDFGITFKCVQENLSRNNKKGTIRGLHYQKSPYGEDKIIQCITGKVFDVLVDIDTASSHYGEWVGIELSEENGRVIYVPHKYAHGFQTLEDNSIMLYHMGNYYNPDAATGINCFSKELNIPWPIPESYIISKKDISLDEFSKY